MQTLVLGVRHQSGISKVSGKPYDMRPSLVVGSKLEPVDRDNLKIRAVGFDSMTIECTPEVFQQVAVYPASKFPMMLDLDLGSVKRGDLAVSYVEGIRLAKVA